ncbi:MAG: hypothetical protein WBX38_18435 [Candidatus Sulfotelmatobacter sp.]
MRFSIRGVCVGLSVRRVSVRRVSVRGVSVRGVSVEERRFSGLP